MNQDEAKEYNDRVNALHESVASIVRVSDNVSAIGRSRELSLAVTKLEEAAMWVTRAILRASEIDKR